MKIAVYAQNAEARYSLSRQTEEVLLRRGILPEVTLFPMLPELLVAGECTAFDLALVAGERGAAALKGLCRTVPVILVGEKSDGPAAFDIGARYFIDIPVDKYKLDNSLTR